MRETTEFCCLISGLSCLIFDAPHMAIVYKTAANVEFKMNIYLPPKPAYLDFQESEMHLRTIGDAAI